MRERDAKVLAQVGVDYGAKAGEFRLILDYLKDCHQYLEHAWLNLSSVHIVRGLVVCATC